MRRILYISILLLLSGCYKFTHYKVPNKEETQFIRNADFSPPPENPSYQLFLVGDTGEPNLNGEDPVFSNLSKHVQASNASEIDNLILLLGDNVYRHGYLNGDGEMATLSREKLDIQINYLLEAGSQSYFIPGNHDYTLLNPLPGKRRIKRQFEKTSEFNDSGIFLSPDPNNRKKWFDIIKVKTASDSLGVVMIDTQRFLNYFQFGTRLHKLAIANIEAEISTHTMIKTWVFATHHPMKSVGDHGVDTTGFKFRQDLAQNKYRKMRRRLNSLVRSIKLDRPEVSIIFASGHDHSLQLFEEEQYIQILSGAGSKSTEIFTDSAPRSLMFAQANIGYAVLSVYDNEEVWVSFYGAYSARKVDYLLYSQKLF
jgi:hypothetical protein